MAAGPRPSAKGLRGVRAVRRRKKEEEKKKKRRRKKKMKEEEEEEALPAPGGSERGSRRPKMAAAAGDVCGSPAGAQPGAAAEARFISSAKVRPARGASCLPPVPQLSSFGPLSPPGATTALPDPRW